MRRFVLIAGSLVATLVVLAAMYLLLPAIGTPSGHALARSVAAQTNGTTDVTQDYCVKTSKPGRWRCPVSDVQNSSGDEYTVAMTSRRCWKARRQGRGETEGEQLKQTAHGCVHLSDQGRILDRIFGPI